MKYSLIAILLFSFTALQAQVKGTVKDNLGDPIAGANLFWQTVLSPCPNPMTSICL